MCPIDAHYHSNEICYVIDQLIPSFTEICCYSFPNRMEYLVIHCTTSSTKVSWALSASKVQAASSGKIIAAMALGALWSSRVEERLHHILILRL